MSVSAWRRRKAPRRIAVTPRRGAATAVCPGSEGCPEVDRGVGSALLDAVPDVAARQPELQRPESEAGHVSAAPPLAEEVVAQEHRLGADERAVEQRQSDLEPG